MRVPDQVAFTIAAQSPQVGACELCSSGPETLRTVVGVQHTRGATVLLAACDRCAIAMRRLIAVAGVASSTATTPITVVEDAADHVPVESAPSDRQGSEQLIHEFGEPIADEDGRALTVRVFGQARGDGTWVGWLVFVPADGSPLRRTPRETTQSNRQHLAYWATGLEKSYIEGALRRATIPQSRG